MKSTPATTSVPVVLLDGTGVRAGHRKLGVGAHLAVGLSGRSGSLGRRRAHTDLLGLTLDQPWEAMADRLAGLEPPELVVVDGEEAITDMVAELWPDTPIQRCWWHLPHGLIKAGYSCARDPHMPWVRHMAGRFGDLPTQALDREWSLEEGEDAFDAFVLDVPAAYTGLHAYLTAARPHAMTFLDPRLRRRLAWLGGPELGTGVLERVMRELNARTDIGGSRWTVEGLRDMLTILTARLFNHPAWTDLTYTLRPDNTIGFDLCAA